MGTASVARVGVLCFRGLVLGNRFAQETQASGLAVRVRVEDLGLGSSPRQGLRAAAQRRPAGSAGQGGQSRIAEGSEIRAQRDIQECLTGLSPAASWPPRAARPQPPQVAWTREHWAWPRAQLRVGRPGLDESCCSASSWRPRWFFYARAYPAGRVNTAATSCGSCRGVAGSRQRLWWLWLRLRRRPFRPPPLQLCRPSLRRVDERFREVNGGASRRCRGSFRASVMPACSVPRARARFTGTWRR